MADASFLAWPFFAAEHRALGPALDAWAARARQRRGVPRRRRGAAAPWSRDLGRDGWLRYAVPAAHGGAFEAVDSRAVCLVRETLARHNALADFAFAMQGLGSAPIVLGGSAELQRRYLPRVADGSAIAAFALSERDAGSDVAAMAMRADRDGDDYVLDGEKTWISNGGIADFYVVFARTGEAPGSRGHQRVRGRRRHAGPGDRRADRPDRAAPAGDAALSRLPHPGHPPARRGRRGLQARDALARHLPRQRRGGRAGPGPARVRRSARARDSAA